MTIHTIPGITYTPFPLPSPHRSSACATGTAGEIHLNTSAPRIMRSAGKHRIPAAARYDGSYGMLYGSVSGMWGTFWSNSAGSAGFGVSPLAFQKTTMSPNASGSRADAYSVRCIRDVK